VLRFRSSEVRRFSELQHLRTSALQNFD